MPYETFSSGLTIQAPTAGTKNWAETLRAQLWAKISAHDHTGSGKGLQIATAAIANLAVTEAKIAAGAVTTTKLGAVSIGTSQIADGAVTEAKLDDDAASRRCLLSSCYSTETDGSMSIGLRALNGSELPQITLPRACKVTHLSVDLRQVITSGTLTVTLYKNGVTTGKNLGITSGVSASGAITTESFAVGDTLGIAITTASAVFASGTSQLMAAAWGLFIE